MSIDTGYTLIKEAKKLYVSHPRRFPQLANALDVVLAEYDARPHATVLPDGSIVRKRSPARIPKRQEAARDAKGSNGTSELPHKDFLNEMRQLVSRYIAVRIVDVEDEVADRIYNEFEVDLKVLIGSLQQRLYSVQRQAKETQEITERTRRSHLREDFLILGMDPPKSVLDPDITKIKRQYRALASTYHPDKQPPGGADMTEKFDAVTQAYTRIMQFYHERNIS